MTQQIPTIDFSAVLKAVQHNCDVADAQFAGDDTLCIYLLKMREYFRWASNLQTNQSIDRSAFGDWMTEKESLWDSLETNDYLPVPLGQQSIDRFDEKEVNNFLNPMGWVYSAGLGRRSRPIFFIGKLLKIDQTDSMEIFLSGGEVARCITAPPAMSLRNRIYIRRDAFCRYLASMVEEWSWKKLDNPMAEVIAHYSFETEPLRALDRLVDNEIENLILHEIGEQVAGKMIGEGWQTLVSNIESPLQELKARAVRDNLADCVSSLPAMLTFNDRVSLDFYYANMTPLRRALFPSFCDAYCRAKGSGNYQNVSRVVAKGKKHWLNISKKLIGIGGLEKIQSVNQKSLEQCLEGCSL